MPTCSLGRLMFVDVSAAEDLETGMQEPKFRAEPTLPIYLKVIDERSFFVMETNYCNG